MLNAYFNELIHLEKNNINIIYNTMARKTLNRKNKRTRARPRTRRNRSRRHVVGGGCSPNSTISRPNLYFPSSGGQYKCCNGNWTTFNGMNKGC